MEYFSLFLSTEASSRPHPTIFVKESVCSRLYVLYLEPWKEQYSRGLIRWLATVQLRTPKNMSWC